MLTNEQTKALMEERIAARGYAVVSHITPIRHAAKSVVKSRDGYLFPRSLCQPHTPRVYAMFTADQNAEVTCKRCLAALAR